MGFVGKIAKTTENPAIKYKSLKHSGLYLIFHRFSILFIDLITIHEVLPYNYTLLSYTFKDAKLFRKTTIYFIVT